MSSVMSGLAAALGGGGGGYDPTQGAAPTDTGQDTGASDQGEASQYSTSLDALDGAEEALHAFIMLDADEADRAAAGKLLQGVLQLKASNQSSQQSGDMKSLQRALQQQGGGPQGPAG